MITLVKMLLRGGRSGRGGLTAYRLLMLGLLSLLLGS